MSDIVLDIDAKGNIHCLYTDKIDLFSIGRVTNIRKASNVEFNEESQKWHVVSLSGEILHTNQSREAAIEWEIEAMSPGGKYYRS
jgi:hypothetical protein